MWMLKKRYMRNLFYYRVGRRFSFFFHWVLPEDNSLHITCPIGRRCHLEHSQNTFLNAQSIGNDFYCLHNVTVGNNGKCDTKPIIGNNVKIYTGAVVVGKIRIGNNVSISANSVVIDDVPDNCLVAGSPARVIKYYK